MAEEALTLRWEAARAPSVSAADAMEPPLDATWNAAPVPGTVAQALTLAGSWAEGRNLDDEEWWYRTRFHAEPGNYIFGTSGLATIADVWLDGEHLLHSENMFRSHDVVVAVEGTEHEMLIRFGALTPLLRPRKPRPRWRTFLVSNQSLRWIRTTLLGRMPEWTVQAVPVGPYGGVTLERLPSLRILRRDLRATCLDDGSGRLEVELELESNGHPSGAEVRIGNICADATVVDLGQSRWNLTATVIIEDVDLWWPHTHGPQPLYNVKVVVFDTTLDLGRVGFRTVSVDRSDGGFRLSVNGTPVFCRGAGWMPIDPVSLTQTAEELVRAFDLFVAANFNMVRFVGTTLYPTEEMLDLCDERGVLVWQDCMFAHLDPPDDPDYQAEVETELAEHFRCVQGRPSLAVICGSAEMEEQATMLGLKRSEWIFPLFDIVVPSLVERLLPGTPYVRSTPTGGVSPLSMNQGLSHYFGVGGFLQPIGDARRAGVRFATECLMFATPPEPSSVEEGFGAAFKAGHDPTWKVTIHRDTGRSSDTEDVVDFYKRELFGLDPLTLRHSRSERNLDLSRATVVECMTSVMAEFRGGGSNCDGALLMAFRDLRMGAGFGIIDALGNPKAPWFALKRIFEPIAVLLTDEALNGLAIHLINDRPAPLIGTITVGLIADGAIEVDRGELPVTVPASGRITLGSDEFFESFRDVTYSYRFTRPAYDLVVVTLTGQVEGRHVERQACYLPLGPRREQEYDLGLRASTKEVDESHWELEIKTDRFAQYVAIDVPGYLPSDSWFHLGPASVRTLSLTAGHESSGPPVGEIRALNAVVTERISA